MGVFSFLTALFGDDAATGDAEPLVLGAELECPYGENHTYLYVETRDIDLNNLPEACVLDREERVNIFPFGSCGGTEHCEYSMGFEPEWRNIKPQRKLVNGNEVITTESEILCLKSGTALKIITSGQEGKFARYLKFVREMALAFLEERINIRGQILLTDLMYDDNPDSAYILAALARLLPNGDFYNESKAQNGLEDTIVRAGMGGYPGLNTLYLNAEMMAAIREASNQQAILFEKDWLARENEKDRVAFNWLGESMMAAGNMAVVYSIMTRNQRVNEAYDKQTRLEEAEIKRAEQEVGNGSGKDRIYIPKDANGNPIPLPKHNVNGQDIPLPDPNATGPHTVLGGRVSSGTGEVYRQSATFPEGTWPTANGYNVPWSEVHWNDHGSPSYHSNPHQHIFNYDFEYNFWERSKPTDFHY